ncbi:hypothetical protein WJ968_33220 [Achromobacter xylosoxidans]
MQVDVVRVAFLDVALHVAGLGLEGDQRQRFLQPVERVHGLELD